MTDVWTKIDREERIRELNIAKHNALGSLLGLIDVVLLAEDHPTVFNMAEKLAKLRQARKDYDVAAAAYLDARLSAS